MNEWNEKVYDAACDPDISLDELKKYINPYKSDEVDNICDTFMVTECPGFFVRYRIIDTTVYNLALKGLKKGIFTIEKDPYSPWSEEDTELCLVCHNDKRLFSFSIIDCLSHRDIVTKKEFNGMLKQLQDQIISQSEYDNWIEETYWKNTVGMTRYYMDHYSESEWRNLFLKDTDANRLLKDFSYKEVARFFSDTLVLPYWDYGLCLEKWKMEEFITCILQSSGFSDDDKAEARYIFNLYTDIFKTYFMDYFDRNEGDGQESRNIGHYTREDIDSPLDMEILSTNIMSGCNDGPEVFEEPAVAYFEYLMYMSHVREYIDRDVNRYSDIFEEEQEEAKEF